MSESNFMGEARQMAAQCWCDETTKHIAMDAALAEAIAWRIANWMDTAAMHARNEEFWRGLVHQCADNLGPVKDKVFIQDDGGIVDTPLALKVPELVAELAAMVDKAPA